MEEQIVGILKEVEAEITIAEICRKYGMSDAIYYNWKAKYGGLATTRHLFCQSCKHVCLPYPLEITAITILISCIISKL